MIDCRQTAKRTIAIQFSFGPGADIGLDVGLTIDFTYKLPFAFTGKIDWVTVGLKPQRAAPVAEAAIPMCEAGRCCRKRGRPLRAHAKHRTTSPPPSSRQGHHSRPKAGRLAVAVSRYAGASSHLRFRQDAGT